MERGVNLKYKLIPIILGVSLLLNVILGAGLVSGIKKT